MDADVGARGSLFERGPVRDPQQFYGRAAETETVLNLLARMQSCSVTGPPRIGKTSFLLHLARPETWRAHGLDPSRYALAYLSFGELLSQSAEEILHVLVLHTIQAAMADPFSGLLQVPRGPLRLHDVRRFLSGLTQRGGRVVWLIDNLDLAGDNPQLDFRFFSALRVLASEPWLAMVIATQDPLHEMALGDHEAGSHLADLCTRVPLGPLTQDETLAMMRNVSPCRGRKLEACWPRIEALAGRSPFALRLFAHQVSRREGKLCEDGDQWAESATLFCREIEPLLTLRWGHLRPEQREAVIRAVEGRAQRADLPLLESAERFLLLRREGGSWRPCSGVIREFVLRQAPQTSAQRVASTARAVRHFATQYFETDEVLPQVVRALSRTAEAHHRWGGRDRAPWWAMMTAVELGCDNAYIGEVRIAARLRDIGHLATPGEILDKPGGLTPEEWAVVRAHPVVGVEILDSLELPPRVKPAVRWHHEREDGSGYPDGLVGCEIPLAARIVGVVDAYVAMTSDRPYRPAMSTADALATLRTSADAYLDTIVTALEKVAVGHTGLTG